MDYKLHTLGDNAIIIELGSEINEETQKKVQTVSRIFEESREDWQVEFVPTFTAVTLYYDPYMASKLAKGSQLPYEAVSDRLREMLSVCSTDIEINRRVIEVPICYGGEFGPDLPFVARHNGLTPQEVIRIHSSREYLVYMLGFAPGFPYLGGMSERIAAPRRATPRQKIPPRSLGIAGSQTGIYPIETPGGWQLIGRTPLNLFQPEKDEPSLLQAGDKIKFHPISEEEYQHWRNSQP